MIINEDFFDDQELDTGNMLSGNDHIETGVSSDTYIVFTSSRNDVDHITEESVFDVKVFYNIFNRAVNQCGFIREYSIDMFVRLYNVGSSEETEQYDVVPGKHRFLNKYMIKKGQFINIWKDSSIYENAKSVLFVVVKCSVENISNYKFINSFNTLIYPLFNITVQYDDIPDGYEKKDRNKSFNSAYWFINGMCHIVHSEDYYNDLLNTYKYADTHGKYSFFWSSIVKNVIPDFIVSKFYDGIYDTESNDINSASYIMGKFGVKKKIQTFFDNIPYKHKKTGYGIPSYDNKFLQQNYKPLLFIDIEVDASGDNYLEPLVCNDIHDRFISMFGSLFSKLISHLDICFRIWEYDKNPMYTRVCSSANLNKFNTEWDSVMDLGNNRIDNIYQNTSTTKNSVAVAFMKYPSGILDNSGDINPYKKDKIYPFKNGWGWMNLLICGRSKPYFD